MEYLVLTISKESRRTQSALCAISGKTNRKEALLTALVPKKSVAQPVGSIKVDQKFGGKPIVEDKKKSFEDNIQGNNNGKSCRVKIESNNPGPTVDDADKVNKDSIVSSCEQTRSNALSPTSTTVNSIEKIENDLGQKAQIRSQATINQVISTTVSQTFKCLV